MVRLGWALGLLLACSGCNACLELNKGRAYPCEMDSGLPDECAGQWRCGLEASGQARCHPVGKPGPYLCATDEACEGWHCGPTGLCYDRADAGAIACRADAGDCAPLWRCAREGTCRPATATGAYLCEVATSAEDCAPGWRCSARTFRCQDRDAGRDYECGSDDDCEQQWRCGLQSRCVDSTGEALLPVSPPQAAAISRLTPPWGLDGPVTHFAASWQFEVAGHGRDGGATEVQSYALADDAGVHLFTLTRAGSYLGSASPRYGAHRVSPLPPDGVAWLASTAGHAFASTKAGLVRMKAEATGGRIEPVGPAALAGAPLLLSSEGPPALAAWADRTLFVLPTANDAGWVSTAPAAITSLAFVPSGAGPTAGEWIWLATDAGLFVAPRTPQGFLDDAGTGVGGAPNFLPVGIAGVGSGCALPAAPAPLAVHTATDFYQFLAVESRPPGGGPVTLTFHQRLGAASATGACSSQGFDSTEGPCRVCPGTSRAERFAYRSTTSSFEIRCTPTPAPDGGLLSLTFRVPRAGLPSDGGFAGVLESSRAFDFVPSTTSTKQAWLESWGAVFDSVGGPGEGASFSRYPTPTRGSQSVLAPAGSSASELWLFEKHQSGDSWVTEGFDRAYVVEGDLAVAQSTGGQRDSLRQFCAAVDGAALALGLRQDELGPSLARRGLYVFPLRRSEGQPIAPAAAVLDGTSAFGVSLSFGMNQPPQGVSCRLDGEAIFHAAVGPMRDGGEVLVVGGEDRLWATETSRLAGDGGVTRVFVRAVPVTAGRFQSLAMVDVRRAGGSDTALGYGLVSSRLFRIRAKSSSSWLTDELALPEGDPLEVWADGANGRVGYVDGRVFSAASRVLLGPATSSPVVDYAAVCSEAYALTEAGALLRLEPSADGGAIGQWRPVELAAARLGPLRSARLYSQGNELLVITPGGIVGRLAVPACP